MMAASGTEARIRVQDVPIIAGVRRFYEAGQVPAGTKRNLEFYAPFARFEDSATDADRFVLADAQTSGGLLVSLEATRAPIFERALRTRDVPVHKIGEVVAGEAGVVRYG
jgi:selenide,water dikinase